VGLVKQLANACSVGQNVWLKARELNDFSSFSSTLKEIIDLKREEAQAIGGSENLYDALLDEYEPGASTEEIAKVLDKLKEQLVPLIAEIGEARASVDASVLRRNFPCDQQREFAVEATTAIGFDYQRGRLDVAAHPFCTEIGPDDCRLTTRFDESFFSPAFFGSLHEAGHGMYEQGLESKYYGTPPGTYCSLGIHESQSRLWENLVGRSPGFWKHFFPRAQHYFAEALGAVDEQSFYSAINEVTPSLIRVEADEATYDLHIIIRFELEQSLLDGSLSVDDLPQAWNDKYEQYLGMRPSTDAEGVLQDIHWSAGLIGYFPTYSLGNIYASQMFLAAREELGDLDLQFAQCQFEPLLNWMRTHIHHAGSRWRAHQLLQRVTSQPIDSRPLVSRLREKLTPIYQL